MFYFLSDASKAYSKHFTEELRAVSKRNKMALDVTNLSPAIVIFHETQNTNILGETGSFPYVWFLRLVSVVLTEMIGMGST